jgi:peptidoglycan/xylan/chitin deacetylase (PgdA/CDA1 family)
VAPVSSRLATRVRGKLDREYVQARWRLLVRATGARTSLEGAVVALSFDDGPVPGSTDRVLDVLHALDVRATFFCVGRNAERHPALLRRIAEEGHAVGSHSQTHPHPRDLSPRQVRHEYETGHRAVEQALGAPVSLFRPPHGHLSAGTIPLLRRQRPWLWSRDPEDWRPGAAREPIERVGGAAGPGDVVLLHDWVEEPEGPEALDRSATIAALPGIVAGVRARGLDFGLLPS